jgi:acetyl esterase
MILDRVNRAFLEGLAAKSEPPVYTLTPEEARKSLLRIQSHDIRKRRAEIKVWKVEADKWSLRILTIRPSGTADLCPVIMYFHGAGWVMGDATTHGRLARQLAVGSDATVVFLEYDRAPEHGYPVAIEQAYAATRYVSDHATLLGVDAACLAVAGDSAGGNIATVVALLAKHRLGPRIAGQLLLYPVTNATFESGSYREFANGPWLTRRAMQWFWDQYLPDHELRKHPTASPLQATAGQLAGLPRSLIITAECDVLRDEGEAYGRNLIEAGVEVVTTRYNATIHDFLMLDALADAAPTRAAMTQAVAFLRSVFAKREGETRVAQIQPPAANASPRN